MSKIGGLRNHKDINMFPVYPQCLWAEKNRLEEDALYLRRNCEKMTVDGREVPIFQTQVRYGNGANGSLVLKIRTRPNGSWMNLSYARRIRTDIPTLPSEK